MNDNMTEKQSYSLILAELMVTIKNGYGKDGYEIAIKAIKAADGREQLPEKLEGMTEDQETVFYTVYDVANLYYQFSGLFMYTDELEKEHEILKDRYEWLRSQYKAAMKSLRDSKRPKKIPEETDGDQVDK